MGYSFEKEDVIEPPARPVVDVTVIATFHNDEEFVSRVLELLERQTVRPTQIILVDDASRDDTRRRLRRAALARDSVEVLAFDENAGVAKARNEALRLAHAKFVWFVDSDDIWDSRIVEELYGRAQEGEWDIVICGAEYTSSPERPGDKLDHVSGLPLTSRQEVATAVVERRIRGYLWNKLFRRAFLPDAPFPHQRSLSDFVGLTRIAQNGPRVAFVSTTLYWHMRRAGSITNSTGPRLHDFERSWAAGRQLGEEVGVEPAALIYFDYWSYYLSSINTVLRLSADPSDAETQIDRFRPLMKVTHIYTLWRFDRKIALNAAAVMLLSRFYTRLYSVARSRRPRSHREAREA